MYAVGFAPWDSGIPDELVDVIEGSDALPPGRALDLGSGMGGKTVYMATKGWQVTGVESVPRALARARDRADKAGVSVDWRRGDVTRLEELGLNTGYDLFFDFGCFHGLNDAQRTRYAAGVASLAAPTATLLMMGFRKALPPVPSGISSAELLRRFPGWKLIWENPTATSPTSAMRRADAGWFWLRRDDP
jgi:SAM-dependent methyltransferase